MARIVLVHGAWSTGAVWIGLVGRLSRLGHEVIAPTLPGHGAPPPEPGAVGLSDYAEALAARLAEGPPALLVGHSMGGMAISAAAELVPEQIARLVYVTAFLPQDGQSLVDLIRGQDAPGITPALRRNGPPGTTTLDPTLVADILFQDAPPKIRDGALAALVPQPNGGQTEAAHLTPGRFGRLPRAYIFCQDDRTITLPLQRAMERASPCSPTFTLPGGHVPQLTRPADLADIIDGLAQ